MAIADQKSPSDNKRWGFFKLLPFRQSVNNSNTTSSSSSSSATHQPRTKVTNKPRTESAWFQFCFFRCAVASAKRRRLKLDPSNKLYFPYEPGKQIRSAIKIKNTSKSHVAFKFQTTAPKSCFMRPPGAILAPGESLIATVFKFVELPENNEKPMNQKSRDKFKIISMKVKGDMDYVPELFDELKDQPATEQILRVVFLNPEHPDPALEKLKRRLADADAAVAASKKPLEDAGPKLIGEGLVIDEWKERRERYLAQQQVEGVVDSV